MLLVVGRSSRGRHRAVGLVAISWSFGMRSGRVVWRMFRTYDHVIVTGV
jgi:hypothetical protein